MYDKFKDRAWKEIAEVKRVPAALIVAFVAGCVGTFFVVNYLHEDHFASLESRINGLKEQLDNSQSVPSTGGAARHVPISVTKFQVHPYQIGKPIGVNIYYHVDVPSLWLTGGRYVMFVPPNDTPEMSENAAWAVYQDTLQDPKNSHIDAQRVAPQGDQWTTMFGPVLTKTNLDRLIGNRVSLWFMGQFRYEGGTVEYCSFTRDNPNVVYLCRLHNGPL